MNNYHHLFTDLEEGLENKLFSKGTVTAVKAGAVLLRTGQIIRSSVIVLEGLVKLYREDFDGGEFFIYHLHPGDGCALSLICDRTFRKSTVTAKAVTDSIILTIPIEETENWSREFKTWFHFVVDSYRNRYEELMETIDHVAFQHMDERLEFYLRRHKNALNSSVLELTNTQIAEELNSSREVISRLMKKLAHDGKVRLLKNGIEILKL